MMERWSQTYMQQQFEQRKGFICRVMCVYIKEGSSRGGWNRGTLGGKRCLLEVRGIGGQVKV
jgi:hypothetical protein